MSTKMKRKRGNKRFREEYVEPEPEEMFEPPMKTANLKKIDHRKKMIGGSKEKLQVPQSVLMQPTHFWRNLDTRGPFFEIYFSFGLHRNRPLFNLIRLIFHKIHTNCKTYLKHDVSRMMADGVIPYVGDLMDEMCEKVLNVELGGAIYNFHVPRMMDCLEKLASKSFITLECHKYPQLVEKLRDLCYVYDIDADQQTLKKIRNVLLRQFYYMAYDLVGFVFDIVPCGLNAVKVNGFSWKKSSAVIENSVYQEFHEDHGFGGYITGLGNMRIVTKVSRKIPFNLLAWLVCEESDHLLEHVLEYGLIQVLPEGVKEFLTEWMIGVRKRLRKQMIGGKINEKVQEWFPGRIPFKTGLGDKKFHSFLSKFARKVLNSRTFTIFDNDWEKYALDSIQSDKKSIAEPYQQFFKVSQLINTDAKSTLSALFSKSHRDRAMLYHTIAQLHRFTIYFVCYTIRHVFHFNGKTKQLMYDGKLDEEFDGFEEFRKYEKNPTIEVPLPKRPILTMPSANTPDIHPVQLRIFPVEGAPLPERKSFVVKTEIPSTAPTPATGSYENCREKNVRPKRERKSSTESPEPVPEKKFTPNPAKKSFTAEPSSVTTDDDRRIEEDGRISEEWKEMYRVLCQWNIDLRDHRDRIEKQYNRIL